MVSLDMFSQSNFQLVLTSCELRLHVVKLVHACLKRLLVKLVDAGLEWPCSLLSKERFRCTRLTKGGMALPRYLYLDRLNGPVTHTPGPACQAQNSETQLVHACRIYSATAVPGQDSVALCRPSYRETDGVWLTKSIAMKIGRAHV